MKDILKRLLAKYLINEDVLLESSFIQVDSNRKVLRQVYLGITNSKFIVAGHNLTNRPLLSHYFSKFSNDSEFEIIKLSPIDCIDLTVHSYTDKILKVVFLLDTVYYYEISERSKQGELWNKWWKWADSIKLVNIDLDSKEESICTSDSYVSHIINDSNLMPEHIELNSAFEITASKSSELILKSSKASLDLGHSQKISNMKLKNINSFFNKMPSSKSMGDYKHKSFVSNSFLTSPSENVIFNNDSLTTAPISFTHYLFQEGKPLFTQSKNKRTSKQKLHSLLSLISSSTTNQEKNESHSMLKFNLPRLPPNITVPISWDQIRIEADDTLERLEMNTREPRSHHHRMTFVYIMPFSDLEQSFPFCVPNSLFRVSRLKRCSSEISFVEMKSDMISSEDKKLLKRSSSLLYLCEGESENINPKYIIKNRYIYNFSNMKSFWMANKKAGMKITHPRHQGYSILRRLDDHQNNKTSIDEAVNDYVREQFLDQGIKNSNLNLISKDINDAELETHLAKVPMYFSQHRIYNKLNFLSFHEKDLTSHLTAIERDLFLRITPEEVIQIVCTGAKICYLPNLEALVLFHRRISRLTISEILKCKSKPDRVLTMAKFITLARNCLMIYNWQSCMAIMSGLQSVPVMMLEDTWDYLRLKRHDKYRTFINIGEEIGNELKRQNRLQKCLLNNWAIIPFLKDILDTCQTKLYEFDTILTEKSLAKETYFSMNTLNKETLSFVHSKISGFKSCRNCLSDEVILMLHRHLFPNLLDHRQSKPLVRYILFQYQKLISKYSLSDRNNEILDFFLTYRYNDEEECYTQSLQSENWTWRNF